jgi:seryl-tRNA synthetase
MVELYEFMIARCSPENLDEAYVKYTDYATLEISSRKLEQRVKELEAERDSAIMELSEVGRKWGESVAKEEALRAEIKAKVAERVAEFRAEVEGEVARMREALNEIDNIQFDLPAKTKIYDKMKAIAKRALGGGA